MMNAIRVSGRTRMPCLRGLPALISCALSLAATAQGINIQTPQLPPRAVTQSAGPAPQPGYGQQPTYGQQPAHGQPTPGYGQHPQGHATPAPGSPMQQRRGGTFSPHQYGQPGAGAAQSLPQMAMVTPSAPGGNCRVQPTPDRQAMSLLGPDGLPRRYLPLGEHRVQFVVHSPDGQWAVALTKLRGEAQFAAMTLDLARCETTNTVELPAAGEDVRFDGESALVQTAGGERRLRLANARLR